MSISVRDTAHFVTDGPLRMPFSFGNVTVTQQPHLFVCVDLDVDGVVTRGVAADGLSPLWFMKNTGFLDGLEAMLGVIRHASTAATNAGTATTIFSLWREIYERQREWATGTSDPPLLWGYGVSLVERALIDAFCRARDEPLGAAVRENTLGLELGYFHDSLAGTEPAALLPAGSRDTVAIRHTIGLTDPLTAGDFNGNDRLADGLPQTLAEHVETHGLQYFKIKIGGDIDRDVERLGRIQSVLEAAGCTDYTVTLDANEQYGTAEQFRAFWSDLCERADIDPLREQIGYIEQPLARGNAFGEETAATFAEWTDRPPIIIDESDARPESLARALACGYDGTSHKNVKGVFKGIANACRIAQLNANEPAREYVLSCEDAANIGPVALLQDFAVVGLLGVGHAERNGHQYFAGLSMFPPDLQDAIVAEHGDLYGRHENGYPVVEIADGTVDIGSVNEAPFGYACDVDPSRFTPLSEWEIEDAL